MSKHRVLQRYLFASLDISGVMCISLLWGWYLVKGEFCVAFMHQLKVSLILEYRNHSNYLTFHDQIMGVKGLLSYPFGLKMWETSKSIQKTCIRFSLVLNGSKI